MKTSHWILVGVLVVVVLSLAAAVVFLALYSETEFDELGERGFIHGAPGRSTPEATLTNAVPGRALPEAPSRAGVSL